MNILKLSSLAVVTVAIAAACHSSKKSTTSSTASSTPAPAPTASAGPAKTTTGILPPTEEQLKAIMAKHPDATLPALTEGYNLYVGVCTDCHGAKSIYRISADRWQPIIDNMAKKAKITDAQKDALSKYVFSVKATQPPADAK